MVVFKRICGNSIKKEFVVIITPIFHTYYSYKVEVLTINLILLRSTDDGITSNLESFVAILSFMIYLWGINPLSSNKPFE